MRVINFKYNYISLEKIKARIINLIFLFIYEQFIKWKNIKYIHSTIFI